MTAPLSWHVQKFAAIWKPVMELQLKLSFRRNLMDHPCKILGEMGFEALGLKPTKHGTPTTRDHSGQEVTAQ